MGWAIRDEVMALFPALAWEVASAMDERPRQDFPRRHGHADRQAIPRFLCRTPERGKVGKDAFRGNHPAYLPGEPIIFPAAVESGSGVVRGPGPADAVCGAHSDH